MAIMRRGRLMHVEDMHARRGLRMLLVKFEPGFDPEFPEELELTVRERKRRHDAPRAPRRDRRLCCAGSGSVPILDIAIGTEDLRSLYDRFHGPNVPDEEAPV